jgi:hypothetical protein
VTTLAVMPDAVRLQMIKQRVEKLNSFQPKARVFFFLFSTMLGTYRDGDGVTLKRRGFLC